MSPERAGIVPKGQTHTPAAPAREPDKIAAMNPQKIVIVGGGHAAAQLCSSLAEAGLAQSLTLVSSEHVPPYHRPPLSKSFLKSAEAERQLHRDEAWFAQHGITLRLDATVTAIDRTGHQISTASGEQIDYDKLVLATGTRPRTLAALSGPISGPISNVATLRLLRDAEALRERLLVATPGRLAVIGGGFIGLEVAATARALGWQVTVLEAAPRLLARSVSPAIAEYLLAHHRADGIEIRLNSVIAAVQRDGDRVSALTLADGELPVDLVLVGIGAEPETALASQAGLALDDGIVVDEAMVTSDPDILAAGDCTAFPLNGRRSRLESVQNANDQARIAAATLLGQSPRYQPLPFFWSDQGSVRLQMAGLWRDGLSTLRRPGPATGTGFSLFHLDGERLVCVESVNAPVDHMMARKLIEKGSSPPASALADPAVPLKSLL